MLTDPIADMLTRVRNANTAMHDEVRMPASKQKVALAAILEKEGYIAGYSVAPSTSGPGDVLTIALERQVRVLRVVAPGERRGVSPPVATPAMNPARYSFC